MNPDVYQQLEHMADAVDRLESQMIDPRDFGRLEAEVKAMQEQVTRLDANVTKLIELASQGRGGIRALWFAGSIVAGVLGWLGADKVFK